MIIQEFREKVLNEPFLEFSEKANSPDYDDIFSQRQDKNVDLVSLETAAAPGDVFETAPDRKITAMGYKARSNASGKEGIVTAWHSFTYGATSLEFLGEHFGELEKYEFKDELDAAFVAKSENSFVITSNQFEYDEGKFANLTSVGDGMQGMYI